METPLVERLAAQVQAHPYQSLFAAAGVGFVLGGGLFTRPAMNAVGFGLRMGVLPVLRRELMGAVVQSILPQAGVGR